MKQHTFFGKGTPQSTGIIPTATNQHYIDLYTREVYLSRGTNTVNDWGDPLIDRAALNLALKTIQLPGNSVVVAMDAVKSGLTPVVAVQPNEHNSNFLVVSDPTFTDPELPESYLLLDITSKDAVIANAELSVYNNTALKMKITGGVDTRILWARQQEYVAPYGFVKLKLIKQPSVDANTRWFAHGDVGTVGSGGGGEADLTDFLKTMTDAYNDVNQKLENTTGQPTEDPSVSGGWSRVISTDINLGATTKATMVLDDSNTAHPLIFLFNGVGTSGARSVEFNLGTNLTKNLIDNYSFEIINNTDIYGRLTVTGGTMKPVCPSGSNYFVPPRSRVIFKLLTNKAGAYQWLVYGQLVNTLPS